MTVSDNKATFDIKDLDGITGYYIQVDGGAFQDGVGNNYAGISGTTSWNFTTADTLATKV